MPHNRAPLREWSFRLLTPAIALVVAIAAAAILFTSLPHRSTRTRVLTGQLLIWMFVVLVAALVIAVIIGYRMSGRWLEVALRTPGGAWAHGRLTLSPGELIFERYRFQMRILSGDRSIFRVHRIGADTNRSPGWKHTWSINPQLRILDLDTDRGPIEIAALPYRIPEIVRQLRGEAAHPTD